MWQQSFLEVKVYNIAKETYWIHLEANTWNVEDQLVNAGDGGANGGVDTISCKRKLKVGEDLRGFIAERKLKVCEDLRGFIVKVIAKACFESSYFKGKDIFSKLRKLQIAISKESLLFRVFGYGLQPMKKQNVITNSEKEIESLNWEIVKERERKCIEAFSLENDLLHLILERSLNDQSLGKDSSKCFTVDNCNNIYFTGHKSTAVVSSWCLILLALHLEWQSHILTKVAQVCREKLPDADSVSHMKIIWGSDANEFKPERFSDGISKACKFPQAYIPFGLGFRLCLGNNLAMVQLKIVFCHIISKFTFSLSPKLQPMKKQNVITNSEKEIESLNWEIVKERERKCIEAFSLENDLLHLILERSLNDQSLGKDSSKCFTVDNCNNIYFTGHKSTAVVSSWCLILLALHLEWQSHILTKVAQVCREKLPDADSVSHMKIVTMVIQETLHLYLPVAFVSKEALEEI
ncbi:Cytochrome P450 - like 10 [Theobroma cacao]|nr:Cytochrome P450 - like 10 [Theobroma cacao]